MIFQEGILLWFWGSREKMSRSEINSEMNSAENNIRKRNKDIRNKAAPPMKLFQYKNQALFTWQLWDIPPTDSYLALHLTRMFAGHKPLPSTWSHIYKQAVNKKGIPGN